MPTRCFDAQTTRCISPRREAATRSRWIRRTSRVQPPTDKSAPSRARPDSSPQANSVVGPITGQGGCGEEDGFQPTPSASVPAPAVPSHDRSARGVRSFDLIEQARNVQRPTATKLFCVFRRGDQLEHKSQDRGSVNMNTDCSEVEYVQAALVRTKHALKIIRSIASHTRVNDRVGDLDTGGP